MKTWDCHCHLSFLSMEEAQAIVEESPENQKWVMGGYQPDEWQAQVQLKKKYPERIKSCYGLHPWYVKSDEFNLQRDLEVLKIWLDQADFMGEVGLDFFGEEEVLKKERQVDIFEKQLDLNKNLPLVFHIVQAHNQALSILKNYKVRGFVHSFSGSIEVAEQYWQQGILLSFGTNIINPNFKKGRQALKELPIEALLVESDTPSHALDQENPLQNLEKVYGELAKLREIEVAELKNQVAANFSKLVGSTE